jgi:transposase InsO family protein
MENFWSTLKTELVYRASWRTREVAENALFEYIDGWYNTRRIQAGLADRSPDEYEAAWYAVSINQPDRSGTTLEPTGAR